MSIVTKTHIEEIMRKIDENSEIHQTSFLEFIDKYWRLNPTTQIFESSYLEMVITTHLFVEDEINTILKTVFPQPEFMKKFTYRQKLKVIRSSFITPADMVDKLEAIGTLRNKFAHDLEYIPLFEDVQKLEPGVRKYKWKENPKSVLIEALISSATGANMLKAYIDALEKQELINLRIFGETTDQTS